MGSNTITNMTNTELNVFVAECEEKYRKLLKLANKLASEMDNLSAQYKEAKAELMNRQTTE